MRSCSQRWMVRVVLVVFLTLPLSGCGLLGKLFKKDGKKEEAEAEKVEEAPVRVVGEIASVHSGEGFVLIRRYFQGHFGAGTTVASLSAGGTTASLRLTGERMGRYFAADIQEGTPTKGDLVIVRRLPEGSEAPSTPLPEAQKPGLGARWGKNLPPSQL